MRKARCKCGNQSIQNLKLSAFYYGEIQLLYIVVASFFVFFFYLCAVFLVGILHKGRGFPFRDADMFGELNKMVN